MAKKLKVSACDIGKWYRTIYGKFVQVTSITPTVVKLLVKATDSEIIVDPSYIIEEIGDNVTAEQKNKVSEKEPEEISEELEKKPEEEDEEDEEMEDGEAFEEEVEEDNEKEEFENELDDVEEETEIEEEIEEPIEEVAKHKKKAKRKTKTKENVKVTKEKIKKITTKSIIIKLCTEKAQTLDELTQAVIDTGNSKSPTAEKVRKTIAVSINLMQKQGINIKRVSRGVYRIFEEE